jgi:hypothetical protein
MKIIRVAAAAALVLSAGVAPAQQKEQNKVYI